MKKFELNYLISNNDFLNRIISGTDERSLELLEKNMERYFPEIPKEEYEKYAKNNMVLIDIINQVKVGFLKWYEFECGIVMLNNLYQKNINSYTYFDEVNPVLIHVDQLTETIVFSFMLSILKWAKEIGNDCDDHDYFVYLLYLFNELGILGQLPAEDGKAMLFDKIVQDMQIMNLATDCYWSTMIFTVAHEIAHAYQRKTNKEYWRKNKKESEQNADKIAYDIFLRLMIEKVSEDYKIEEYTYLAPMMYMDFFDLYYYTDYILYGKTYSSCTHPTPEVRKDELFRVVTQDIYQFDTEEGNAVYQGFCQAYDLYKEKLVEYKRLGKLDGIIRTELRKLR